MSSNWNSSNYRPQQGNFDSRARDEVQNLGKKGNEQTHSGAGSQNQNDFSSSQGGNRSSGTGLWNNSNNSKADTGYMPRGSRSSNDNRNIDDYYDFPGE